MWNIVWQEFQRDQPAEIQIRSLVDDSHPTAAKFLDDPVMRNGLAGNQNMVRAF